MTVMFHLALPVLNLENAKDFYVNHLGCDVGRVRENWLDLYFFGHQLTLHQKPDEVLSVEDQGVRHFGAVLDWKDWERLGQRLLELNLPSMQGPSVKYSGQPKEQGKIFLRDPSGNGIELKAYRNQRIALELAKLS